ncbi:hypothetical protein AB0368_27405 [Actinoplanes sp. NPDC051475]|uniref:hypothetical protein n=1 Tax=Actinoplanes sp. NPDC051475 TaxID=3157225 RepID=UPI00344BDCC2
MVQVDVFWSYAIGAGYGTAAAASAAARPAARLLDDRRFAATVLFLACVFAPSGIWLLWRFTGWETMYAASSPADLPGWLVAAFALTNVTQGMLGYVAARELWRRGHRYLAWLQMPLGYLAMFFVLAHGWDGTGYRRFFAPTPQAWQAGTAPDLSSFAGSEVGLTLLGMGVVLVPLLLWLQASWWAEATGDRPASRAALVGLLLVTVFGLGLGTAAAATALMTLLGPVVGGVAALALAVVALHPAGPGGRLAGRFHVPVGGPRG